MNPSYDRARLLLFFKQIDGLLPDGKKRGSAVLLPVDKWDKSA